VARDKFLSTAATRHPTVGSCLWFGRDALAESDEFRDRKAADVDVADGAVSAPWTESADRRTACAPWTALPAIIYGTPMQPVADAAPSRWSPTAVACARVHGLSTGRLSFEEGHARIPMSSLSGTASNDLETDSVIVRRHGRRQGRGRRADSSAMARRGQREQDQPPSGDGKAVCVTEPLSSDSSSTECG
jgi:hypothetical protein